MSFKSLRSLALAGVLFVSACQEGAMTASAEVDVGLDAGLEAAMIQAGVEAEVSGDVERADALRHGAQALRWGIRPSVIEVKVMGGSFRYLALVVGVVHERPDGERVLVRSLVAWNGRPVSALLQVTSGRDGAEFGASARGHWRDLVNRNVWVATAGPANVDLVALGNACQVQSLDPTRRCVLASWNVRVDGRFRLLESGAATGDAIEIRTGASGVNGLVFKPQD